MSTHECDTLLAAQKASGHAITRCVDNLYKLKAELISADVVKARIQLLDNYWKGFYEMHLEIYDYAEELKENEYFTNDYFAQIEEIYLNSKVTLSAKLAKLIEELQSALPPTGDQPSGQPIRITTTEHSLPKLTLPRFSGRQEEWESFKELFSSMVKNSHTLTPVLKLQHLVSCLDGEARQRVENLTIVGDNFEVAWKALESRYDNKRLRLSVQLNKLLGMRPATGKSVAEITRLMDTAQQGI